MATLRTMRKRRKQRERLAVDNYNYLDKQCCLYYLLFMRKITKLTKAQTALFPRYVEEWTRIGLCTEPADRPRAEAGIVAAYAAAGLAVPRIVWCSSPFAQAITRSVIANNKSVGDSVRASVGDSVWASVGASVRDNVWASVWDSVRDSVRASVRDSVRDSARASVWDSVWASVWDSGYGQHDANWLAFYWFFREQCGLVAETEKLSGLVEIARSANWFLPHEKICWVSERHNIVHQNARHQLHAEFGPALAYPDGWALHYLNGVKIEPWMSEDHPDAIDARKVLQIRNVDQRREVIRRMGMERIVGQLEPKILSTQADYQLLAVDMNHGEPWRFLKMVNPSIGCIHIEAVPRECETVQNAINWRASQNINQDWFPVQLT